MRLDEGTEGTEGTEGSAVASSAVVVELDQGVGVAWSTWQDKKHQEAEDVVYTRGTFMWDPMYTMVRVSQKVTISVICHGISLPFHPFHFKRHVWDSVRTAG